MSNPKKWRAKQRTTTPNSRQKRNGLFLDARPTCEACWIRPAAHAHNDLQKGHPLRFDHQFMRVLCEGCHVTLHQAIAVVVRIRLGK